MSAAPPDSPAVPATMRDTSAPSTPDGALPVPREMEVEVEERVERILAPLIPASKKGDVLGRITREVSHMIVEHYSGPLPHPSHFRQFDDVVPGAADRILTMTEAEQRHRHQWEDRALSGQFTLALLGVVGGWLLGVLLVGGAIYLAVQDKDAVAGGMLTAGAVSMVGAFVKGRNLFEGSKPKTETAAPAKPATAKRATAKKK